MIQLAVCQHPDQELQCIGDPQCPPCKELSGYILYLFCVLFNQHFLDICAMADGYQLSVDRGIKVISPPRQN